MAHANITLVQGLYAVFGRGDIAVIANAVTPEATWEIVGRESDFPTLGRRHRKRGGGLSGLAAAKNCDNAYGLRCHGVHIIVLLPVRRRIW